MIMFFLRRLLLEACCLLLPAFFNFLFFFNFWLKRQRSAALAVFQVTVLNMFNR